MRRLGPARLRCDRTDRSQLQLLGFRSGSDRFARSFGGRFGFACWHVARWIPVDASGVARAQPFSRARADLDPKRSGCRAGETIVRTTEERMGAPWCGERRVANVRFPVRPGLLRFGVDREMASNESRPFRAPGRCAD